MEGTTLGTKKRQKRGRGRKGSPWIWQRKGRDFWYAHVGGRTVNLGLDVKAAEQEFHRLRLEESQNEPDSTSRPTGISLLELCDRFVAWTRQRRAGSTADWYKQMLRPFLAAVDSKLPASTYRPHHIDSFLEGQSEWGANTKAGCVAAISRAFAWGVRQGLLDSNPVAMVERPRRERRRFALTPELVDRILAAANPAFRQLVELAVETGARARELLAVEARHWDPVREAWVFPATEHKTGRSTGRPRTIFLTGYAADITKRLVERHPAGKLLRNTKGKPWKAATVAGTFRYLTPKLGLPKGICLTSFRHYFATQALKRLTAHEVALLLGHSTSQTTEVHYGHVELDLVHMRGLVERAAGRG